MVLADFFSYGHHDALPADHRPQSQRKGDCDFHPRRDELRGVIQAPLIVVEDGQSLAEILAVSFFFKSRRDSLTRYMSLRKLRTWFSGTPAQFLEVGHFRPYVVDHVA